MFFFFFFKYIYIVCFLFKSTDTVAKQTNKQTQKLKAKNQRMGLPLI